MLCGSLREQALQRLEPTCMGDRTLQRRDDPCEGEEREAERRGRGEREGGEHATVTAQPHGRHGKENRRDEHVQVANGLRVREIGSRREGMSIGVIGRIPARCSTPFTSSLSNPPLRLSPPPAYSCEASHFPAPQKPAAHGRCLPPRRTPAHRPPPTRTRRGQGRRQSTCLRQVSGQGSIQYRSETE